MVQESRPITASPADQSIPYPASPSARGEAVTADAVGSTARTSAISAWSFLIAPGLFLFSAALLDFKLGEHPGFVYNWESYTVYRFFPWWDHPSTSIFHVTEGLMTDSGSSPVLA